MSILTIKRLLYTILFLLPVACGSRGCGCDDSKTLAKLVTKHGAVERDWAPHLEEWDNAKVGSRFAVGDGVRAGSNSGAELKLKQGPYVRLHADTTIRFQQSLDAPEVAGVDIKTGEAELITGSEEVKLIIGIGLVEMDPNSKVTITRAGENLQIQVAIGMAALHLNNENGKEARALKAGQKITVTIGDAVLVIREDETDPLIQTTDTAQSTGVSNATEAASDPLGAKPKDAKSNFLFLTSPTVADFRVLGGESFVVHTSRPPVLVKIDFQKACPNGGVVQVAGKRSSVRGDVDANMVFPRGRTRYQVRCLDEGGTVTEDVVLKGKGIVLRDTGTAMLQKRAPSSTLDADGRIYKIFYQNRLPTVTVQWSRAPTAKRYNLRIDSKPGGTRNVSLPKPSHTLKSGSLRDGTHKFRFESSGSPKRTSRTTTTVIRFDNAAPKAHVNKPRDGSFGLGDTVEVQGVAVKGWNASLVDGILNVDRALRFSGTTVYSGKYRGIVIRLTHPRQGVHYYLRRAQN
jgi:hypothetical protein